MGSRAAVLQVRIHLPPAVSPANFPVQGRVRISDRVYMSPRAGLPTCWRMITESGNVPTVCLDGDLAAEVTPGAASARRTLFVTRQELYLACPNDRPNHVGIAVQRHLRAGRIQERDGKLYAT